MLREYLNEKKISIGKEEEKDLLQFMDLVLKVNESMNLTSITEEKPFFTKHFLDSLWPMKYVDFSEKKIIDIGTGAGFPAIPLKICHRESEFLLLDSLQKRMDFLEVVISTLDLKKIQTLHGRAEEVGRKEEYREEFDIAISRAVAKLNTLVEYSLPFVKKGGLFVAMKGSKGLEELEEAKNGIRILGGKVVDVKEYRLDETEHDRVLILIEKIKNTPKKYPRGGGKPSKKPL